MSDVEPRPAKRIRYSARRATINESNGSNSSASGQSRYMLRSKAKSEGIEVKHVTLDALRKRRNRFRNLMKLSDDCLLTIFGHMDPYTMTNVAGASSRLNDLARYHFRIKHTCFGTASLIENGTMNVEMIAEIFEKFGDLITSLHLLPDLFVQANKTHGKTSYDLLKKAKRNCHNLKTLTLEDFTIPHEKMHKVRSLFQPIETLTLDSCTLINCFSLGAMNHLKSLKIQGGEHSRQIFNRNFAKLEQLEISDSEIFEDDSLIHMINQNPTLKRVSIVNCEYISTRVFDAVGKLKQLEEFEFHQYYRRRSDEMFQTDLLQLASLGNLKVLKLHCTKMSVARLLEAFVKNKNPIEHLELVSAPIDDNTYENINKLKTIKTLRLNDMNGLTEHHVLGFVRELKLLETLHINTQAKFNRSSLKAMVRYGNRLSCLKINSPMLTLDVDTYQDMLIILQKREQNIKLDLTIYGYGHQLRVPETISKGSNEKWFSVKELNGAHNHIFQHQAISVEGDDEDDMQFESFDEIDVDIYGLETEDGPSDSENESDFDY